MGSHVSCFNLPPQKGGKRASSSTTGKKDSPHACLRHVEAWCQVMAELPPEDQGLDVC